jgi:mRNA-degrading endonuclease RelE of RelBE toxin-antitoxin system
MEYGVVFDEAALAFLKGLPRELRERIFAKVLKAKAEPQHFFERLAGRADYKLRIGGYRVIADINTEERRIETTLAGHRRDIYKRLQRR